MNAQCFDCFGGRRVAASTVDVMLLIGPILHAWIFVRSGYGELFDIRPMPRHSGARPSRFHGLHLGAGGILRRSRDLVRLDIIIVFMLVAMFSSRRYWDFTGAAVRAQEMNFYKNMAMLGGFFFLFVTGSGRLSIDHWLKPKS